MNNEIAIYSREVAKNGDVWQEGVVRKDNEEFPFTVVKHAGGIEGWFKESECYLDNRVYKGANISAVKELLRNAK